STYAAAGRPRPPTPAPYYQWTHWPTACRRATTLRTPHRWCVHPQMYLTVPKRLRCYKCPRILLADRFLSLSKPAKQLLLYLVVGHPSRNIFSYSLPFPLENVDSA